MYIEDLLGRYPKLLKHPQLQPDLPSGIFRHELCHFLEREMAKAYLKNFGFQECFGGDLAYGSSHKYFDAFMKRELRVLSLEQVSPIGIESTSLRVNFSTETMTQIYAFGKERAYYEYKEAQEKFYTREIWWNLFEEKYVRL